MAEIQADENKRRRNNRTWIVILVIVAVLLMLCVCVVAALVVMNVGGGNGSRIESFIEQRGGILTEPNEARRQVDQTFAVGDMPTVVVDNRVGSVAVVAGDEGQVSVVATARAWGAGQDAARRMADATTIDIVQAASDRIEITAGAPSFETGLRTPQVDLEIRVPRQCHLEVTNRVGSVTIDDLVGVVQAEVTTGEIQVENLVMTGDCRLSTDVGSVQVSMSRESTFYLDAHTNLGTVTSDFAVSDGGQTQRGLQQGLTGAVGDDPTSTLTLRVGTGEIGLKATDR